MDLNKLTLADRIILGSGIVLFIAYFLTWFSVDIEGFGDLGSAGEASGSDVGFFWSTFPMLIGLLLAGLVVASKLFDVKLPELPIPWGQAFLGAGALAAILVVLKLIIGESDEGIPGVEVNRGIGLFLAALAAIGLAVGGYLKMQAGEDDAAPPAGGDTGSAPF
ncbi:MAG: hypothetical protein ABWZ52_07215 [Acidimicrobiales bacterium]